MPPVGFEPTISTGERPQTYALDRAATGTGYQKMHAHKIITLTTWHNITGDKNFAVGLVSPNY